VLVERAPHEPRLPHAAGADDGHEPAVVLREQRREPLELDRSPDEAVVGERGARARGGPRRAERVVHGPELGARRDAELVVEPAHEVAVRRAGARGLAALREPVQVELQRRLVERVDVEQLRRERDALVGVEAGVEAAQRGAAPRVSHRSRS
jgi:hypothetical protein